MHCKSFRDIPRDIRLFLVIYRETLWYIAVAACSRGRQCCTQLPTFFKIPPTVSVYISNCPIRILNWRLPIFLFENNSNTMGKRDSGKDKSQVKPSKGKGRAKLKPDALNEMLQDVAEELAVTGGTGSPTPSPNNEGPGASASRAGGAGGAASGASASDTTANHLPVALLEGRVEQRTKERDEVTKDRDFGKCRRIGEENCRTGG
jgi:hypothetical protein